MSQPADPRELARKLAEDAKAKALVKRQADEAEAAAKKLADEAEAAAMQLAEETAAREAEEARAREVAAKASEELDHKALAKRLVEEAKARVAAAHANPNTLHHTAPPIHAPSPAPVAAPARKLSALEAMRQAIESEKTAAALPSGPRELVALKLPGFTIVDVHALTRRDTFRALWTAHRIRAASDGDARMFVTADVLMDAASRVPAGSMFGLHVRYAGQDHALFVDTSHGVLIGLTDRPELYLAGL